MQVDVSFSFAKVYNIEKLDIVKGQPFTINTDFVGVSKWFSDEDHVLKLNVLGNNADALSMETGTSTILIMNESLAVEKQLTIRVVNDIVPMAADLGITAGEAELK